MRAIAGGRKPWRGLRVVIATALVALLAGCDVPVTLIGVEVEGGAPFPEGGTAYLYATAIYSDGTMRFANDGASWSASDTSIATVAPGGVVTRVSTGAVVITASYEGASGTVTLHVP